MGALENIENLLSQLKFRFLFLISAFIGFLFIVNIVLFFQKNSLYIIFYFYFVYITFILIKSISDIIHLKNPTKLQFFIFLLRYFSIIFAYIALFAFIYNTAFYLGDGYFVKDGNLYFISSFLKALSLSGFTFFSYGVNILPVKSMEFIMIIQMFLSQIVIVGFMVALLVEFIKKIK